MVDTFISILGDLTLRTLNVSSFAQQAVTFLCLNFNGQSTRFNELPKTRCPSGIRSQIVSSFWYTSTLGATWCIFRTFLAAGMVLWVSLILTGALADLSVLICEIERRFSGSQVPCCIPVNWSGQRDMFRPDVSKDATAYFYGGGLVMHVHEADNCYIVICRCIGWRKFLTISGDRRWCPTNHLCRGYKLKSSAPC